MARAGLDSTLKRHAGASCNQRARKSLSRLVLGTAGPPATNAFVGIRRPATKAVHLDEWRRKKRSHPTPAHPSERPTHASAIMFAAMLRTDCMWRARIHSLCFYFGPDPVELARNSGATRAQLRRCSGADMATPGRCPTSTLGRNSSGARRQIGGARC